MSTENCKMSCANSGNPQDIAVPQGSPEDSAVEIEIESLAAGGRGVGRSGGVVWFVPGTVPGDRVAASARRRQASYVEGRLVRMLRPSPDRREPPCPLQARCGGCPWMALDEAGQRHWKRTLVVDALRRIGQNEVPVDEVRAVAGVLGYRNKLELTLGRDGAGKPAIGFHPADPAASGLVDVASCPLQTDVANRVLATARDHLLERPDGWAGQAGAGREPFRLVIRASRHTGKVLVALRETSTPFPRAGTLARRLEAAHPELAGVVRIHARPGRRGGARVLPVRGKTWLVERVGGVSYRLPAASFLQVNLDAAELLIGLVRAAAGPVGGKSVIELYGGVGTFAVDLAKRGASVTVCEADVDAVRCGRLAARSAGVDRIDFLHSDVTAFLRGCLRDGRRAQVVLADPPRSGLGARLPKQIAALQPERVVLVSCDPATLARDARRLTEAGYAAERAIPVDLFPQTAHVETVLALSRA